MFAFPPRFYNDLCISIPLLPLEIRIASRFYNEFCVQGPLLALEIRTPAEVLYRILQFKHSSFAFSPRFYNELGITIPLLALEIRIPAEVLYWIICLRPIAGTRNSHSRRGCIVKSVFEAPCLHPRFVFSPRIYNEFCDLAPQIRVFTEDPKWIQRSVTPDSRFHCRSIMNSAFWHPRLAFSLRIYNEFCVLAPQIRVFTSDSIVIFAFKRFAGIANSLFHLRFYSNICFQALCWYSEFAFPPQIL